jgi:glycosyltransferase involved in cell wall biosynthesis
MPVRDGERYVAAAVESVLGQSLPELELVVVDDGSVDGTGAVLSRIRDSRLCVVANERPLGIPASLNRGLALAQGRYIARHDADDVSEPMRLERQVELLDARPDVALCGTWARLVDERGRRVGVARPPAEPAELLPALSTGNRLVHGSVAFRPEAVRALGGYREEFAFAQDYDLYLRLSERHLLASVPEELYEVRIHSAAATLRETARQHAFALLARELAEERRGRDRDALDDRRPIDVLLRDTLARHPPDGLHVALASYRWRLGDLRGYRRALLGLIACDRRRHDNYLRLLASLGGRRVATAAERLLVPGRRAEWILGGERDQSEAR